MALPCTQVETDMTKCASDAEIINKVGQIYLDVAIVNEYIN
jgi:hypothetical protein